MAPKGKPGIRPVRVFTARSLTEANLAVAFLDEAGIAAQVQDENFHEALDGAALNIAPGGGIGVVVPSDKAPEAGKVLQKFRRHKGKGGEEE